LKLSSNSLLKRYVKLGETFDPATVKLESSLRVNTLRIKEEDLVLRLEKKRIKLEKIPWLTHGYHYRSYFSLGATQEYLQGYYFLQESASQAAVEALNPQPGETVLDMAASPGGKTTQIAQYMENKGKIVALEKNKKRLNALINNIQRMGVTNCLVYGIDALNVEILKLEFDKVLLDAPCSGNFTSESKWFEKRDMEGIHKNAKLQREMLIKAFSVLKKNGVLVYSTCSMEPEENELNIEWLMDKFDTKVEKIEIKNGSNGLTQVFNNSIRKEISKTKRFWPHLHHTQGFFIAKITKK